MAEHPKLLDRADLADRGIKYSRQHIFRLVRTGTFPKPVRLGGGGRVAWLENEIDDWIAACVTERDAEAENDAAA